jgi:hypothetical protein
LSGEGGPPAGPEAAPPGGRPSPLPGTVEARSGQWLEDLRASEAGPEAPCPGPPAPVAWGRPGWEGRAVAAAKRLALNSVWGRLRRGGG